MITQILFVRRVAQDEPEPSGRIRVDGFLQIKFFERNRVLDRILADRFRELEMKLTIDDPVIGHVQNRAIFQKELWKVLSLTAIDIHRR